MYKDAIRGATILVGDFTEPLNQNPLLEKNSRKYCIPRQDYISTAEQLIEELAKKGVERENMAFLTHQSYAPEDISYSGRVSVTGNSLIIDAAESLRLHNSDFDSGFVFKCPINGGKPYRSRGSIIKRTFDFPKNLIGKIILDAYKIPGQPNLDFEVYADTGKLFYHDAFLAHQMKMM